MDGTLPIFLFLKLQGRGGGGAPITPRGWIGVDGMNLDHNIIQKVHLSNEGPKKKFEIIRTWFLSSLNMGVF